MKYLITGGSGFIGTHIIRFLLARKDCEFILNIDINESKISNQRIVNHAVDIRKNINVESLKFKDFDVCIHLAALCKEPGYRWEEYFETNHLGTENVITLCEQLSIPKILFTSTMMVYRAGEILRVEESITSPDTAYGISKLLAEKELEKWLLRGSQRGLKIIRPAVVFGEYENANFTRLYHSLKKGFFPFIGRKSTVKSSIYVREVVSFIDFLISNSTKNSIFNLAFPEQHEMKIIISAFKKVFGFKAFTPVLPYKLMLVFSYMFEFINNIGIKNSIHHRRIQKLFHSTNIWPQSAIDEGYKFNYTLESALEDWKNSNDPNL